MGYELFRISERTLVLVMCGKPSDWLLVCNEKQRQGDMRDNQRVFRDPYLCLSVSLFPLASAPVYLFFNHNSLADSRQACFGIYSMFLGTGNGGD
jgi:hypothetical protein